MRNWHPSSTPLSFYCAEVGKLNVCQTPGSQSLVCKSVFPFRCKCWRFERWMWGTDCFSWCFILLLLANRFMEAGAFPQQCLRIQFPAVWVLSGCSHGGVFSWRSHCCKVDMFFKSTVQSMDCWCIPVPDVAEGGRRGLSWRVRWAIYSGSHPGVPA